MSSNSSLDEATLVAVGALLSEGKRAGVGICFVPIGKEWVVQYLEGHQGGPLAEGVTLQAASDAALAKLLQHWPRDQGSLEDSLVVLLPDRNEAIAWGVAHDEWLQCIARTTSGARCRNGVFDDQPGTYVTLRGSRSGTAFDLQGSGRDYGRRADLQRCGLHVDRDNSDAVMHEGMRLPVKQRSNYEAVV